MAIELKQNLKLAQKLVMTPQLRQAIRLLQLGRLELADALRAEMEQNPMLEEAVPTLEEGAKQILWTLVRTPRYYRANKCAVPHRYDEYGRCEVCHAPDPAIRRDLSRNLAALVPEANINTILPVRFAYPGANDFISRNTESFCAEFMALVKLIFNFFAQIFGMLK